MDGLTCTRERAVARWVVGVAGTVAAAGLNRHGGHSARWNKPGSPANGYRKAEED